jgi:hypothetical protein
MSDSGDGFRFLFAIITTDALLEAISRLPHPGNLSQQGRSRNSQVVLVGALATIVGCAPLAEAREINPRLGAQHGTLTQLQRAEQQIANGQEVKRTAPHKAIGSYLAECNCESRLATTRLRANSCRWTNIPSIKEHTPSKLTKSSHDKRHGKVNCFILTPSRWVAKKGVFA